MTPGTADLLVEACHQLSGERQSRGPLGGRVELWESLAAMPSGGCARATAGWPHFAVHPDYRPIRRFLDPPLDRCAMSCTYHRYALRHPRARPQSERALASNAAMPPAHAGGIAVNASHPILFAVDQTIRRCSLVHLSGALRVASRKSAVDRAGRACSGPRLERAHGGDGRRQDGARTRFGPIDGRPLARRHRAPRRRGGLCRGRLLGPRGDARRDSGEPARERAPKRGGETSWSWCSRDGSAPTGAPAPFSTVARPRSQTYASWERA